MKQQKQKIDAELLMMVCLVNKLLLVVVTYNKIVIIPRFELPVSTKTASCI
jgi:hypothetical protein